MAALSRLILSLSRPIVMGVRDELRRCLLMALAALFALLGVVMFAVSLFLYLRDSFVAGALLIVSGLIAVATYRLLGDGTSKPSRGEAPRETAQSFQGQDAPVARNDSASLQLALAALLAGAAVGASADLRQGLGSVFLALCGTKPRDTP